MPAEIAALCRHLPHRDLCIQRDLCKEMVIWDGQKTDAVPFPEEPRAAIPERMTRIRAACSPASSRSRWWATCMVKGMAIVRRRLLLRHQEAPAPSTV